MDQWTYGTVLYLRRRRLNYTLSFSCIKQIMCSSSSPSTSAVPPMSSHTTRFLLASFIFTLHISFGCTLHSLSTKLDLKSKLSLCHIVSILLVLPSPLPSPSVLNPPTYQHSSQIPHFNPFLTFHLQKQLGNSLVNSPF